ncbi:MAG: NAD+ synthase [Planctomycetaceae bacterium]
MKIALAQLNPTIGDFPGNSELVRFATREAARLGAELVVASELVLSGYPPKDLLLREGFVAAADRALDELAKSLAGGPAVIVGHPTHRGLSAGRVANAASLLDGGTVQATIHKSLLPNYDVFDERRYFRPAARVAPIEFRGRKLGVHVCEDAWWGEKQTFYHEAPLSQTDPVAELAAGGAEILINLSASPFELEKPERRFQLITRHAKRHALPFLFVNQVGGNDDLVFDGHSIVVGPRGELLHQLPGFKPELRVIDIDAPVPAIPFEQPSREAYLFDALTLGLRDYMHKTGFQECVLGLSGGIDSAVTACIAASAVGKQNVHGLLMPSRYSSRHSVDDARALAENLGIDHEIIPIDAAHRAYESLPVIGADLTSQPGGLPDQNLQARIRGACVMVRSNRHGWIALATGNKSELAVGYCTLYGDMAGGFAVLCDVLKRDVYGLARHINQVVEKRAVIPESTINKAPSAELAPNQFDQDVLPPYELLDNILEGLIEDEASVATLSRTYPPETVRWVATRVDRNEFKRRQMPPGIKLTQRAFGSGRRMPMAARFENH